MRCVINRSGKRLAPMLNRNPYLREAGFQALFMALHLAAIVHAMAAAYHVRRLRDALEGRERG